MRYWSPLLERFVALGSVMWGGSSSWVRCLRRGVDNVQGPLLAASSMADTLLGETLGCGEVICYRIDLSTMLLL